MVRLPEDLEDFQAQYLSKRKEIYPVDGASQASKDQPMSEVPAWQRGRRHNNQFIPQTVNTDREAFVKGAKILAQSEDGWSKGLAEVPDFFISPEYNASLICLETLRSWGFKHVENIILKKVLNPRGGRFNPIGVVRLYASLPDVGEFYIKSVTHSVT